MDPDVLDNEVGNEADDIHQKWLDAKKKKAAEAGETESLMDSSDTGTWEQTTVPDGGWGWVVCFGAFMCMVILDGMLFSFGVFFLDLLDYYGESKGKTAMVGSMLMGMHLFLGPVTSALVNIWGIRAVTMTGGIIATAAFTLSVFSPTLEFLTFTYGMLGGFGVSMIYIPSILAVGFYFEKRRALANGITSSGSGIGAFIYAPLCNFLQETYSWQGGLLILAALVLHCVVFGALYRPINIRKRRTKEELFDLEVKAEDLRSFSHGHIPSIVVSQKDFKYGSDMDIIPKVMSLHQVADTPVHQSSVSLHLSNKLLKQNPQFVHSQPALSPNNKNMKYITKQLKPLERKDLFYSGSLYRIPQYNNNGVGSLTQVEKPATMGTERSKFQQFSKLKDAFVRVAGLSLLKNPVFILIMLSSVLWTTHSTVLTILPDYSVQQGISSSKAAILLSMIGGANVFGRIGSGWLSDRPKVDVLVVNMCALYIGGIMCICVPFSAQYSLLLTEAAVFGLCMATWTSLRPIVLVELLGIDNLTNAFGLLAMFQGVAFLVGPPMAGFLYDLTGSYRFPFLMAGVAFICSGLLLVPLRQLNNRARKQAAAV